MRAKYLRVAAILEYVFTFLYFFVTALFFSVSNLLYILFLILGLLSLCLGLYTESIINRVKQDPEFNKTDKIVMIVITALSVIDCIPLVFNLLAFFDKREAKPREPKEEKIREKKQEKWYKTPVVLTAAIALVGTFAFSLVANIFETTGGKVQVKDGTITKAESDQFLKGQPLNVTEYRIDDPDVSISYTVYKPKAASPTNPYPVVFVTPGFTRTKATMSQYAIEMSRRGAVVFTIDPGSQGATTHGGYEYNDETGEYDLDEQVNKIQNSYSVARSGMGYLLGYVYNNVEKFEYIDRDRIGLMGHSAGGGDACKLAADYAGSTYEESIVKALYISGYIKTSAANVFYKLRANTALSYAKYDEGSFRYQD